MSHFPSSSFEWTSMTNQEYLEKNDSRFADLFENVVARFTYPELALAAIIEAVGSAVAAVFVSLSLLVPCCGWGARKARALNLWNRAAFAALAMTLDVLGFFSPWLTSKCIELITTRLFPEKTAEETKPLISGEEQNTGVAQGGASAQEHQVEQKAALEKSVEIYRGTLEAVAGAATKSVATMPSLLRLQALTEMETPTPEEGKTARVIRLKEMAFGRQCDFSETDLSAEDQAKRLDELRSITESDKADVQEAVRELCMERAKETALAKAKELATSKLLKDILATLPDLDLCSMDQLNNTIELMQLVKSWRSKSQKIAHEDFKGLVLSRPMQSYVALQVLFNMLELKNMTLEQLLALSPEEFSKEVSAWEPLSKEHPVLRDLLIKWGQLLAKVEKEDESEAKKWEALQKELIRQVGNPRYVNAIIAEMESKPPKPADMGALKAKEKAIALVRSYYYTDLQEHLKSILELDNNTIAQLKADPSFIPTRVAGGEECFTEELWRKCKVMVNALVEARRVVDKFREPGFNGQDRKDFETNLAKLPLSFQKQMRQEFNTARNRFQLESIRGQVRLWKTKGKIAANLAPKAQKTLDLLQHQGVNISLTDDDLDVDALMWTVEKFLDQHDLWTKDIVPAKMQEMIDDALERAVLLSPRVRAALIAKSTDPRFITEMMKLDTKTVGRLTAVMLLHVVNPADLEQPGRSLAEAHRTFALLLSHSKEVSRNLLRNKYRVTIIPRSKVLSHLPMFADLKGVNTFDGRSWDGVRGISSGGRHTDGYCYASFGEELLLGKNSPLKGGRHAPGHSTPAHEIWHHIYKGGLDQGKAHNGTDLAVIKSRVKTLLEQKQAKIAEYDKRGELYPGWRFVTGETDKTSTCSYANSNEHEWGAMFAQAFLHAIGGYHPEHFSFTQRPVNTKEKLQRLGKEEAEMCTLFGEVLGPDTTVPFSNDWNPDVEYGKKS